MIQNFRNPFGQTRLPAILLAGLGLCLFQSACASPLAKEASSNHGQPNVLFIAIDDLRPELGVYGRSLLKTPAIDKLASAGVTFANAYSNVPVCGASRASLMAGLHPTRDRFVGVDARIDVDAPGIPTLPAFFKANGYTTISLGKIIHGRKDAASSWSENPWHPRDDAKRGYDSFRDYQLTENITLDLDADQQPPAYEAADVADDAYFDGKIANRAIENLGSLQKEGKPFFLAVGFVKPHLPFNAPQKYWDRYPAETISLTDNPLFPATAPSEARHSWGELRKYAEIPDKKLPVPDEVALKLIRGYYAATSYADAQVGRVLAELENLGLADDTIVVLWGDHGWSLGEHGLWAKHSTFNVANQIPLIVRAPGIQQGEIAQGLVESVDIYPSLVELAGLPLPGHLQGNSFKPILMDTGVTTNEAVYPRWKNGDSIRTSRYYYTEWRNQQGKVTARMLYDHLNDPDERTNVAGQPDYAEVVKDLSSRLEMHIKHLSGS
jgi:arylsulfatase A-like enzyme